MVVCCSMAFHQTIAIYGNHCQPTRTSVVDRGGLVAKSAVHNGQLQANRETPPSYQCNFCGRELNGSYKLRQHIRDVHERVPHPCHICGKQLSSAGSLHNHIKLCHRP